MTTAPVLGIDVGGTTVKSALLGADGELLDIRRTPTPRDDPHGVALVQLVDDLVTSYGARWDVRGDSSGTGGTGRTIDAVGVVVPGIVDDDAGVVVAAVNLGWRDLPLRERIAARLRLPVAFGHDVRAGALAEAAHAHAATGDRGEIWAFVPVGTGIAAAVVIDGITVASGGWAGEIGQVEVASNALRDGISPRTLERVASAGAIARRVGAPDARTVADLVRAEDDRAGTVWNDAVDALAESLAWMTGTIGVSRFIIGGGLAESGALLLDPLRAAVHARLPGLRAPLITAAALGDRAAMMGAALMAREVER